MGLGGGEARHEGGVETQVVDSGEAPGEGVADGEEVVEVGSRVVAAAEAVAGLGQRPGVAAVDGIADVDPAVREAGLGVEDVESAAAGVAGGQRAVEEAVAHSVAGDQGAGAADAEGVTGLVGGHEVACKGKNGRQKPPSRIKWPASEGVSVEADGSQLLRAQPPQVSVRPALNYREEQRADGLKGGLPEGGTPNALALCLEFHLQAVLPWLLPHPPLELGFAPLGPLDSADDGGRLLRERVAGVGAVVEAHENVGPEAKLGLDGLLGAEAVGLLALGGAEDGLVARDRAQLWVRWNAFTTSPGTPQASRSAASSPRTTPRVASGKKAGSVTSPWGVRRTSTGRLHPQADPGNVRTLRDRHKTIKAISVHEAGESEPPSGLLPTPIHACPLQDLRVKLTAEQKETDGS